MNNLNRVLCAAVKYNGIVICGYRHGDCFDIIKELKNKICLDNIITGFLLSSGEFVNRERAYVIAVKAKQIKNKEKSYPELDSWIQIKKYVPILISEDLY